MKVQIRRSVLTFQYEVQTQEEGFSVWHTCASFKTHEEAEKYANKLKENKKPKRAAKKKARK